MNRKELIETMAAAGTDRERAAVLLTLSDRMTADFAEQLHRACETAGFEDGAAFIRLRLAAMAAPRDLCGLMPADIAVDLERYRAAMAVFAAGGGA